MPRLQGVQNCTMTDMSIIVKLLLLVFVYGKMHLSSVCKHTACIDAAAEVPWRVSLCKMMCKAHCSCSHSQVGIERMRFCCNDGVHAFGGFSDALWIQHARRRGRHMTKSSHQRPTLFSTELPALQKAARQAAKGNMQDSNTSDDLYALFSQAYTVL